MPEELVDGGADHLMLVVLPERSERSAVVSRLMESGIATSVHFQPLHRFAWMRENADIVRTGVATAESIADRALSLPLHSRLRDGDVDRVCDALASALA